MEDLEGHRLCEVEDIANGQALGLLRENGEDRVFAVRQGAIVHVYLNSCPHNWRPLEFKRHQFLSADGEHIICYAHGAHFEISDGSCFHGPCVGQNLIKLDAKIEDGWVVIGELPTVF